jgi:hypothetical protein
MTTDDIDFLTYRIAVAAFTLFRKDFDAASAYIQERCAARGVEYKRSLTTYLSIA